MKNISKKCPKCDDTMYISEFKCPSCSTTIRGEFDIELSESMLDRLDDEDKYFVLVFLQTGGKIQDVERVMGISYPTVKAKLEEVQAKLKGESRDWFETDEFDDAAFKAEMKEFKRKLKKKVRHHVRESLRRSLGFESHFHTPHPPNSPHFDFDAHGCTQPGFDPDFATVDYGDIEDDVRNDLKKAHEEKQAGIKAIIDKLETGEIDYDTAMKEIDELKK